MSTIILKNAFEAFPDAIDPELSRRNQESNPTRTVFRTASGAKSYTQDERYHTVTPQPTRNPPVSADKNRVSGELYVLLPSIGQLRKSSVSLASSRVGAIVPKKKMGPKEPITTAVILSQNLWNFFVWNFCIIVKVSIKKVILFFLGIFFQILQYGTPSCNLHICRVDIFCIEYFCDFDAVSSFFKTHLYDTSCIEKIFFHFPHSIFDIFHRFYCVVAGSEIKRKTSIFCCKSIHKNTSYLWCFSDGFWAVPIIWSETPVHNMPRIPHDIPDSFERSVYCRRDGEFGHRYKS